jgi:hypothetical protein
MDSLHTKDQSQLKYIFVAGAPGSKWSSVVKNIYYSPDIDQTDYTDARTYYHEAWGQRELMHLGTYFDPGMEFGQDFDRLDQLTPEECEQEFDRPFSGTGVRIVKSHVFCHHTDFLRTHWPDCPIVTVYRPTDACLGWWVRCGHFDITYPDYAEYYRDFTWMYRRIQEQNHDMVRALNKTATHTVWNNVDLCDALGIRPPTKQYRQDYVASDVDVKVFKGKDHAKQLG